jgi:addiction module RelB/DinJ family antitoxin
MDWATDPFSAMINFINLPFNKNFIKSLDICEIIVYNKYITYDSKESINMTSKVQFNMDVNVKAEMSALCDKLGMTMSQAFNMFASAFLREHGLPSQVATISEEVWYDEEFGNLLDTSTSLYEAIEELERGEGTPPDDEQIERIKAIRARNKVSA